MLRSKHLLISDGFQGDVVHTGFAGNSYVLVLQCLLGHTEWCEHCRGIRGGETRLMPDTQRPNHDPASMQASVSLQLPLHPARQGQVLHHSELLIRQYLANVTTVNLARRV